MDSIKIGDRIFNWRGITWAVQTELDLAWSAISQSWLNGEGRIDYNAEELYKIVKLAYTPDRGALMTFDEFMKISVTDGDTVKKKLTENVNLSQMLNRLFPHVNKLQDTTEQSTGMASPI